MSSASVPTRPDAIVVGGGIGGLTTSLCLARRGLHVQVLEQAEAFTDVGAGIQLSPNCTRVLLSLGLGAELEAIASAPSAAEFRDWRTGRLLASAPLGATAEQRYGAPYFHVHRADLIAVLERAARREARIQLITGAKVVDVRQTTDRVVAETLDGAHEGSFLVGADGIHSTVAAALFDAPAPRFTGNVAWRGLVPAERIDPDQLAPTVTAWWGPRRHFVHYFVRGRAWINCVCVIETPGWEVESWSESGDVSELADAFQGWHPRVRALIEAMDPHACFRWALFDRQPMPTWSRDRVALLGDACHATLPFLAQGAALAVEDAAVLSRSLDLFSDVRVALARYSDLRQTRAARVQAASRRNARVFHLSGPAARLRNLAAPLAARHTADWVYRYDALANEP